MKLLTALVAAAGIFGFAGAAAAQCAGSHKPATDQTAETPILILPGTTTGS